MLTKKPKRTPLKADLEKNIKSEYYNIARVKRQAILKFQKGLNGQLADVDKLDLMRKLKKNFKDGKISAPTDKMKEHQMKKANAKRLRKTH